MCLIKTGKRKITEKDMYVLKSSRKRAFKYVFLSYFESFPYITDKLYEKGRFTKFKARFSKYLTSQVFHVFNVEYSKQKADCFGDGDSGDYGIFKIPRGTEYYEGDCSDLGVFAIEYYAPLTKENKHLILNQ